MESATDDEGTEPAAGMSAVAQDLRSYGRRRGRKLSPRQDRLMRELLPRVSPDLGRPAPQELARALFVAPVREAWLEIGFGGGEHLLWQARHNPGVGLIGAEPFEDGVVKVLAAIEDEGLGNVAVHGDDARALLRWLPHASIARAFILFPDPWPKRRHVKRRLINPGLLALLARVLKPGAELRIATDIGDYARTILMAFQATEAFVWLAARPDDWRRRSDDWCATRYEAKALREGRRSCYLRFARR
ncbi:MAG: tRNA (guanine(46)-N(7))-methyltransferase TrmB [Hyphomicrobiaceae bacterium]|nr:tRNA (guanine(46)-N(7))-methyltransferase TrmB [Hyphomicrobiaceae bacterium]